MSWEIWDTAQVEDAMVRLVLPGAKCLEANIFWVVCSNIGIWHGLERHRGRSPSSERSIHYCMITSYNLPQCKLSSSARVRMVRNHTKAKTIGSDKVL